MSTVQPQGPNFFTESSPIKFPTPWKKMLTVQNEAFKHKSLWGTFNIQTTIETNNFITFCLFKTQFLCLNMQHPHTWKLFQTHLFAVYFEV